MFNEPHGDIRTMAATVRQFYDAFILSGFSPEQAMDLTKLAWRASIESQRG